MIDPKQVTNFKRTRAELFEFAVFCVCVAGKNSDQTAQKVHALCNDPNFLTAMSIQWEVGNVTPEFIAVVDKFLKTYKIGQYRRIAPAIVELNQLDLSKVYFTQLMKIKGIGPKTAAFFLLHTQEDSRIPVIDTHMVKYMAAHGSNIKVTSDLKQYLANALGVLIQIGKDYPSKSLAYADLHIWTKYSGRAL